MKRDQTHEIARMASAVLKRRAADRPITVTEKKLLAAYRFILREWAEVYGFEQSDPYFLTDSPQMIKTAHRFVQQHRKKAR